MTGRLIIDGPRSPRENMATDEALLLSCEAGGAGFPVLRFYWWTQPTLSLGAKERLEDAADVEACRRLGVAVVRRSTGGRAVLHHHELTYSIASPLGRSPFDASVLASYQRLAGAMASGLRRIGLELELTEGARRARGAHMPCFAAAGRCELAWRGRKVVGSAQRRLRRSVLQHGSLLIRAEVKLLAAVTGADPAALAVSMIGIEEVLGRNVTREELIAALRGDLLDALGMEPSGGALSQHELLSVEKLVAAGRFDDMTAC